jgi:hypothetical protein
MSGSWCAARSTPSMGAAWEPISVWWPWCESQPPARSSWPGGCSTAQPPRKAKRPGSPTR